MKKYTVLSFMLFLLAAGLHGQATLSIQGTIQKSFGGAVDDGKYSLTFRLYTTESGGTPVWSETQGDIEVIGGVYSALLGAANPLTAGFNTVYYLGISVDGGQELTPRTRLTSAPYALSLIGQSNTFPSAGPVGVGIVTPDAQLHVYKSDGHVQQIIGTTADYGANLTLKAGEHIGYLDVNQYAYQMVSPNKSINIVPANSSGRVHLYGNGSVKAYTDEEGWVVSGRMTSTGTLNTQNGDITSGNGQDLRLYRNGDRHIALRGDGWTQFDKGVYIPNQNAQYFNYAFPTSNAGVPNGWSPIFPSTQGMSILANHNIGGANFFILSDARIKKDMQQSNGASDLARLMTLRVTDYVNIDTLAKGNGRIKGFIAQQVEAVFPEAINISSNCIPSIYTRPVSIQIQNGQARFQLTCAHGLSVGDEVRIHLKDNGANEFKVVSVEGDQSFTVTGWSGETDVQNMFIYGKKVKDFRTVDYDRIHTLNVSATQELARRVAQLEAENAALRQKSGDAESLRSELNDLKARFSKLESLLNANANR